MKPFKPGDWPNIEPRRETWRTDTELRLLWQYGPERASAIVDGHDPATEADIAAWRRLGEPR